MDVSKKSDHIQIKIKNPNPSQETSESSKDSNKDLKDIDVPCTFKIKIGSQNLEHGCIKDQWQYPNQDPDVKPKSGAFSILRIRIWGLKGHGCSLHLQNQVREPKFIILVYQRPVTISKSRSRCQTPIRNLQHPSGPKWGLKGHGCSLHLQNQDREPKFGSWFYQRPVPISKWQSICQTPVRKL